MAVAREWRAVATMEGAAAYEAYFRATMLPRLASVPGWRSGRLLRRPLGDEVELIAIKIFDTIEAVRAFAGEDAEAAVLPPEVLPMLARWDERCLIAEVVVDADGESGAGA
jgi:hypothetical protein